MQEADLNTVLIPNVLDYPNKFDTYLGGWSTALDPDDYSIFHSSEIPSKATPSGEQLPRLEERHGGQAASGWSLRARPGQAQGDLRAVPGSHPRRAPVLLPWADLAHTGLSKRVGTQNEALDLTSVGINYYNTTPGRSLRSKRSDHAVPSSRTQAVAPVATACVVPSPVDANRRPSEPDAETSGASMATYVLRRLIQAIPILVGISVVSFLIVNLAPGDPIGPVPVRPVSAADDPEPDPAVRPRQAHCPSSSSAGSPPSGSSPSSPRPGATRSSTGGRSSRRSSRRSRPPSLLMGTSLVVTMIVVDPARRPRRGQAVQLGGQDHHDPRDHRLRAAVVRARHPAAVHLLDQAQLVPVVPGRLSRSAKKRTTRRLPVAPRAAGVEPGHPAGRRLEPLHALVDARGAPAGLHPHGQGQGPRGIAGRCSSTPCATRSSRSSRCWA